MTTSLTVDDRSPASPAGVSPVTRWWPVAVILAGLALWWAGLRTIDVAELDGAGLIGVLSPLVFLGYPLVLIGAIGEIRRSERRSWVLAGATVVLLVMVYGLQPAIESAARLQVASLHAGLSEYIAQTGTTRTAFDTRFSWPAFFTAVAFLCRAAGVDNPEPLLLWAPLVLAGMAVLAFRALAHAIFAGRRAGWLATWIFLLGNWTEQDYFSPQAVSIVVMMVILAIVAQYLVRPGILRAPASAGDDRLIPRAPIRDRIWAQLLVLLLVVVLAPLHQLTPLAVTGMLLVILLSGRLHARWLPALSAVPVLAWFVLGAGDFWRGQFGKITESFGRIDSSLNKGINDRLVGDAGHQAIVQLRIGLTVAIALLAVSGIIVLSRRGVRYWLLPVLGFCAFGLAFVQPYGGEVLVRCFLYALSWLAIAGAVALSALLRRGRRRAGRSAATPLSRVAAPAVAVLILSLIGVGTVTARGGNDAYVAVTAADNDAMNTVYAAAQSGDRVVSLLWYTPMLMSRLADVRQLAAPQLGPEGQCDVPAEMADCIENGNVRYVVLNPQQDSAGVILKGFPAGWTQGIRDQLVTSGSYAPLFDRDGVVVLERTTAREAG